MAAVTGGTYTSAPDTPSPVFPDRLIRPLPKRPIRSRLSAEAAGSILYPPSPPVARLFYGAYSGNGEAVNDAKVYVQQTDFGYEHTPEDEYHHPYEDGLDSGDEDGPVVVRRSVGVSRSSSTGADNRQKYAKHVTPGSNRSVASGPDGYDAFENTNNKKKRKIPTSGSLGTHSGLSTELANLGLSAGGEANGVALDDGSGTGSYYGSGNPASPAGSGSARGRYLRSSSARSQPSGGAWAGVLPGKGRRDWVYRTQESTAPDQGIISAAIANAANASAQDNTGLLDHAKPAPANTQFTFTCESDSSKGIAWQSQQSYAMGNWRSRPVPQPAPAPPSGQRGAPTQGTQTTDPNAPAHGNAQSPHGGDGTQGSARGRKPRSARSLYALAARQRRIQQQYTNLHHPPAPEDIWICEFCEYESIFGRPPEALIRQYEVKDRKERQRLAEKRRLLEKAKMKGRKGKKATKNAAKNNNNNNPPPAQAHNHHHHHHHQHGGYDRQHSSVDDSHGHLGDDYAGDEFDDEIPPLHPTQPGHSKQQPPPPPPPQQQQSMPSIPSHANAKPYTGNHGGSGGGRGITQPS